MTTPPTDDGGSMSTGCNFPGHAATSAGGLMVLAAALGLLRRRR
jgi:LPXTG-motif cell wall-anchored protein